MNHKPKAKLPAILEKIADFTVNPAAGWYLCADGNVWFSEYHLTGNEGPLTDFIGRAAQYRLKWINGYPEKAAQSGPR